MAVPQAYREDLEAFLTRRHDQGGDHWATADGRWGTGSPFSTYDCMLSLVELGVPRSDPVLRGAAEVVLGQWEQDGRIRPAPKATTYPCHTANGARVVARAGLARDRRMRRTYEHLLEHQQEDGGWRCSTVKLGKSRRTDASNPGVTLAALDAFRFTPAAGEDERLDAGVAFLLDHWRTRKPLGPCHFGIGSLFQQVEYPFLRYNVFHYAYVLSFYPAAHGTRAFDEVLALLESKLEGGGLVVENPNRRLAKLAFCRKGEVSERATRRYRELLRNLG